MSTPIHLFHISKRVIFRPIALLLHLFRDTSCFVYSHHAFPLILSSTSKRSISTRDVYKPENARHSGAEYMKRVENAYCNRNSPTSASFFITNPAFSTEPNNKKKKSRPCILEKKLHFSPINISHVEPGNVIKMECVAIYT